MAPAAMSIDEVLCHFKDLEDPRSEVNRKHPFVSVVTLSVMGVLAGASGPTGIATWAKHNHEFLRSLLDLPNGIPGKDVFRRILCALNPEAFQRGFASWLAGLHAIAGEQLPDGMRQTYAVDGKTLRRSHDKKNGLGALHLVSVWASQCGITLAQVATDQKSNEITAIPQVLQLVGLKGAIVTIDAMGTQKAIAAQIVDGGGDYVLALKGNQESLHDEVVDYAIEQMENDFADVKAREYKTIDTGHGRVETRHYIQMPAPKSLSGLNKWKGLRTIGLVILTCLRDGKETSETRFFISSLAMGVKQFAKAIRSHWGIENSCHWSLDVTYREDESRTREPNARENLAWLNRFTLSLLKQHKDKQTVAMRRRVCGWNTKFLVEVLTAQGG